VQFLTKKPAAHASYASIVAAHEVALCRDEEPPGVPGRYNGVLLPSLRRFTLPARFQGCGSVEAGTNLLYFLRPDGVLTAEFPIGVYASPKPYLPFLLRAKVLRCRSIDREKRRCGSSLLGLLSGRTDRAPGPRAGPKRGRVGSPTCRSSVAVPPLSAAEETDPRRPRLLRQPRRALLPMPHPRRPRRVLLRA